MSKINVLASSHVPFFLFAPQLMLTYLLTAWENKYKSKVTLSLKVIHISKVVK